MGKTQDVFGTAPKSVFNKQFMHVQHQEAPGIGGGLVASGDNLRTLNTVVTNEIVGASLAANLITLPAGDYFFDIVAHFSVQSSYQFNAKHYLKDDSDNVLLIGPNVEVESGGSSQSDTTKCGPSGRVTLSATTAVKLITWSSAASTHDFVFGPGIDDGSLNNNVFIDFKIWKLDAVTETIVFQDPLLPVPAGTMIIGNVSGLGYRNTDALTIEVDPGVCMSDDNSAVISYSGGTVAPTPGTDVLYHLFVCSDDTVKPSTDILGADITGVDKRWIGFCLFDATPELIGIDCGIDGGISFNAGSGIEIGSLYAAAGQTQNLNIDATKWLPRERVGEASFSIRGVPLSSAQYRRGEVRRGQTDTGDLLYYQQNASITVFGLMIFGDDWVRLRNVHTHGNAIACTIYGDLMSCKIVR